MSDLRGLAELPEKHCLAEFTTNRFRCRICEVFAEIVAESGTKKTSPDKPSDGYSTEKHHNVPCITSSVIYNNEKDELVIFAVNRSLTEEAELDVITEGFDDFCLHSHTELYCEEIDSVNTADEQTVSPRCVNVTDGKIILKKHSFNMIIYKK